MCVYLYVYVCECICRVCPEGIQPCNMIYRDIYWRTCKIQDTLYTGQCHLNPFKVGTLDLTQFSQSPSAAPSYFPECRWQYEISSLPKVILVLGKAKSHTAPTLGLSVAESPGWFDVLPKNSAQDMMHEQAHCCDEAAQSPAAHSWSLLNHLNSFCKGMFKLNATFDADSCFYSLCHFECNSHTVHMLTQSYLPPPLASTVKLSLFMHVYSHLLSLAARLHLCCSNSSHYISNSWTFFRQTLCVCVCVCVYNFHLLNKT